MKAILKLVLVALIANATWHLFTAYTTHYKFRDAVEAASQYGSAETETQLRERVLALGDQYDVPIATDSFTIRRENQHTIIDGSYSRPVDLLPGYSYSWRFSWHVDTLALGSAGASGPGK